MNSETECRSHLNGIELRNDVVLARADFERLKRDGATPRVLEMAGESVSDAERRLLDHRRVVAGLQPLRRERRRVEHSTWF
jgi:hypothetical protein